MKILSFNLHEDLMSFLIDYSHVTVEGNVDRELK